MWAVRLLFPFAVSASRESRRPLFFSGRRLFHAKKVTLFPKKLYLIAEETSFQQKKNLRPTRVRMEGGSLQIGGPGYFGIAAHGDKELQSRFPCGEHRLFDGGGVS